VYHQGGAQHFSGRLRSPHFSEEDDEEDELDDDDDDDGSDDDSDNGGPPQSTTSSFADKHSSPIHSFNSRSPTTINGGFNYPPISSSTSMHPSLGPQSKASLRLPPLLINDPSKPPSKLPPIYTQFMREFSAAPPSGGPTGSHLPSANPPSVPHETCAELRKQNVNPHWVVLPRFGDPCPFSDKNSCMRRDWRPAMWERHVQTHLPDTMKEFWECPHCFRPFNRKCAFVNHLRKTRTECGVKGTLDQIPESMWRDRWFHEPMPLRYPEGDIQRRKWQNHTEE